MNKIINNTRAKTRGNTIYMKYGIVGSTAWNSVLVHETTHVWQNQNGGRDYMSKTFYDQTQATINDGLGYRNLLIFSYPIS